MSKTPLLVFTFCYAPMNVTGAFRMNRFVKYLPSFGYKPIVFSSFHPDVPTSKKLKDEIPPDAVVYRRRTWFPDAMARKSINIYHGSKSPLKRMILKPLVILKDLIASPDIHILWALGSIPALVRIIRKHRIKVMMVTGGPYSLIVAAVILKFITGIKVVEDYRDPWGSYCLEVSFSFIRRVYNKYVSRFCYRHSDGLISANETLIEVLRASVSGLDIPVRLIPNGFDPEDFPKDLQEMDNGQYIRFAYAGKFDIHDSKYNPVMLMKAWKRFRESWKGKKPVMEIYWSLNDDTMRFMNQYSEGDIFTPGFQPHDKLMRLLSRADVLLHFHYPETGGNTLSMKVFEYANIGVPMVSFSSPTSNVAKMIHRLNIGYSSENDDIEEMVNLLFKAVELDRETFRSGINMESAQAYDVRNLTGQLVDLLEEVVEK